MSISKHYQLIQKSEDEFKVIQLIKSESIPEINKNYRNIYNIDYRRSDKRSIKIYNFRHKGR